MYVSLYSVARFYGGPEEGGWWYDVSKFERVIAVEDCEVKSVTLARALNESAREQRREEGRSQGRFSVMGGSDDVYLSEKTRGEHDTTREPTPHYC